MTTAASPALEKLAALVGEWDVELSFPAQPSEAVHARASFEWLEDGAFLIYRLGDKATGPPYSITVIGGDDSAGVYSVLYTDNRSVSRIYQMRLEGAEWRMWREAPGFWQRFVGTLSDDGSTITARWEKSSDGASWHHDFDMTYHRLS